MEARAITSCWEEVNLGYGTVRAWSGKDFIIDTPYGKLVCRVAAGCLLRPEVGDKVLVSSSNEKSYILSVLERDSSSPYALEIGEVSLTSEEETMRIEAKRLQLSASEKATLDTVELETRAMSCRILFKDLFLFSDNIMARAKRLNLLVDLFSSCVNKLTQRVKNYYSFIEGIEQKKVGRLRYLVKESLWLRGKRAFVKGEEKVKIDGQKINLG